MHDFVKYFLNFDIMRKAWPYLLSGLGVTVETAISIVVFGVFVGLLLAVIDVGCRRLKYGRPINFLIRVYVDVLRASPYLVLLMLVYFGLAFVGITFSAYQATVVTFGACLSAFVEEIFRGAIEGIDKGQTEAARSLGLSFFQTMWYVLIPQAVRIAIPPLTNRAVAITKATALASAISLPELLKQARWTQGQYANPSPLIAATLLFILLFFPLTRVTLYLEKRFGKGL